MESNCEKLNVEFFNLLMKMITELNKKVSPDQLAKILEYSSKCTMVCADSVLNALNITNNTGEYWSSIKSELLSQKTD